MEALILFLVIFFPGIYALPPLEFISYGIAAGLDAPRVIPFSISRELGRLATYTLPSLALVLYLIHKAAPRAAAPGLASLLKAAAPARRDMIPLAIGLPALVIIGLFVPFLGSLFAPVFAPHFAAMPPPFRVEGPASLSGWLVVLAACLGTGYLEEIYFRYYLLTRLEKAAVSPAARVIFSAALFAAIHIHQGHWGMLNAAIAGVFLAALFLRYRSIHGIALAHAGYNVFVYAMGTVGT